MADHNPMQGPVDALSGKHAVKIENITDEVFKLIARIVGPRLAPFFQLFIAWLSFVAFSYTFSFFVASPIAEVFYQSSKAPIYFTVEYSPTLGAWIWEFDEIVRLWHNKILYEPYYLPILAGWFYLGFIGGLYFLISDWFVIIATTIYITNVILYFWNHFSELWQTAAYYIAQNVPVVHSIIDKFNITDYAVQLRNEYYYDHAWKYSVALVFLTLLLFARRGFEKANNCTLPFAFSHFTTARGLMSLDKLKSYKRSFWDR
jgi:hypothetical protein